ncbi:MAG: hypothetical protein ACRCSO_01755, partial [Sphingomonas sp.]
MSEQDRHGGERLSTAIALSRRYPGVASLMLGAIAAAGFAPTNLWPLTLIAFAAWLAIVHAAPSLRTALASG